MPTITCARCSQPKVVTTSHFNFMQKKGSPMYCGRVCSAAARYRGAEYRREKDRLKSRKQRERIYAERGRAPKHHELHGKFGSAEYYVWAGMKARCSNPKHISYKDYGARGISVCERWVNSFANFMDDMGPRPEGMTLDRKNNDGNYEPTNCKWSTRVEQRHNRRDTKTDEFIGAARMLTDSYRTPRTSEEASQWQADRRRAEEMV